MLLTYHLYLNRIIVSLEVILYYFHKQNFCYHLKVINFLNSPLADTPLLKYEKFFEDDIHIGRQRAADSLEGLFPREADVELRLAQRAVEVEENVAEPVEDHRLTPVAPITS